MNPTLFLMALVFLGLFIWYAGTDLDRRRRWLALLLTALIVGISGIALIHPEAERSGKEGDSAPPWPAWINIKPGIDISGGTQFTIQLAGKPKSEALDQAVEVIRGRIDSMGTTEPLIQPAGENRILVQIPGIEEAQKGEFRRQLERVALLEFVMVHPLGDSLLPQIEAGEARVPFEYRVVDYFYVDNQDNQRKTRKLLVKKRAGMTGEMVERAWATYDQLMLPNAVLELSGKGKNRFYEFSKEIIEESGQSGQPGTMAILLDGDAYSAAGFKNNRPIDSQQVTIDGLKEDEARELSNVLENPLQTPVSIVDERGVDPTLGKASIDSGMRASVIGFALVVVFMVIYYRMAGLIAVFALLVNVFIIFGLLAQFQVTLTLPGVAGIILIIGMAVDANVLIYERIREELDSGNEVIHAIRAGFSKAFSSIVDSNLTTLIAAGILFWLGSGALKGFAVVLCVGILSSLFAALVVSRAGFDLLAWGGKLKQLRITHFLSKTNYSFMAVRRICLVGSGLMILLAVTTYLRKGDAVFGVDFVGGDLLTMRFDERVPDNEVRQAVGDGGITVQYQKVTGSDEEYLILGTPFGGAEAAEAKILSSFPAAGFERTSLDKVDATISAEFLRKAITGIVAGLIGTFIYVMWRFEASFAIGAILALIHDVIITLGQFALAGHQLSMVTVGAILTVAGYSINDTIIIFDRIREGIRQQPGTKLADLIDLCVNATLSRTLLTSGTTILAVLALHIFGGLVIHDFAFMLLIGIVVGTYSSIFIASPIVLMFGKRAQRELQQAAAAELA